MKTSQLQRTALVVCNPIRPRALDLLPEVEGEFASAGLTSARCPTTPARPDGGATSLLSSGRWCVELIVVLGGDGTVRAVAEAVVASGADVPVCVVPAGTANLVARSHGVGDVRTALSALRRALADGGVRESGADGLGPGGLGSGVSWRDLGWVRLQRPDGQWTPELGFCVSAGFGRSGETILATPEPAKRLLGAAGYGVGALDRLSAAGVPVDVRTEPGGALERLDSVWALECGLISGIAPRRRRGRTPVLRDRGDAAARRVGSGTRAGLGGASQQLSGLGKGVRIFRFGGPATGSLSALAVDLSAESHTARPSGGVRTVVRRAGLWGRVFAAGLGCPRERVPELVEAPVQRLALQSAQPIAAHIDGEAAGHVIGAELRIDPEALSIVTSPSAR